MTFDTQVLKVIGSPIDFDKKDLNYLYWFRSLLQKIDSSLHFQGLPEDWSQDFFLMCLWSRGYVAVFDTQRWGISFNPCTVSGFDFYYQPTKALVANPLLQKEFTIHKDCEILKLTPDFRGIFDILDFYAKKLCELSVAIDMGLENAKLPLIFTAKNQSQAATLRRVYDRVQKGESLIIYKDEQVNEEEIIPSKEPFEVWNQDFKQTYAVSILLDDMQKILDSFYAEIGLPTMVQNKASHTLQSEADFQLSQSQARISCWKTTLDESFVKINKLFGLNLSVEIASNEQNDEGGDSYEEYVQKSKSTAS